MTKRRVGTLLTVAGTALALATASPASAVREDCKSGQTCGWIDAYFSNGWYAAVGIGNYYPGGAYNNSMSSIRNDRSGTTATYYDYSGSSARICLRYNYEVGNLAGNTMQDKTSYIQVSGYSC